MIRVVACNVGGRLHPRSVAEVVRVLTSGSHRLRELAGTLTDAFAAAGEGRGETFPNPDPFVRHDHVSVDDRIDVRRSWVPSEAPVGVASHRRPVLAELESGAPA